MSDVLNAKLKAEAEKLVGRDALVSKFGIDCFALVDKLLRQLGAETAADGSVAVTSKADYDWGDGIMLTSIQPGDILQFSKHVVTVQKFTRTDSGWFETEARILTRPHHTGIVVAVHKDGSVTVVEQNVAPNPKKVRRSVIPRLEGEETKRIGSDEKVTTKVEGTVKAYRPVPKAPKGASLMHPGRSVPAGGSRMVAYGVVPSQGGVKRMPGPVGLETSKVGDVVA